LLLIIFAFGPIEAWRFGTSNRGFPAGMIPMKLSKLGLIAFFLCVGVAFVVGEGKPPATKTADTEAALMRAKLASSQKIVEGLMVQDLTLIRTGALELEMICDATEWHAEEDQVYAHFRADLQRIAQKLARLSQNEDLDGATYTYMHSIATCMSCHAYCRDVLHLARTKPNLQRTPLPDGDGKAPSTIILQ